MRNSANRSEQTISGEGLLENVIDNETETNQKLDSRIQGFENDMKNPPYPTLGKGVNDYILPKTSSPEFLNSHSFIKKFFPQRCVLLQYANIPEKFKILKLVQNDKFFGLFSIFQGVGEKKPAFTLAEGATHVDVFHDIRKPAFTLAEILVTLGVIGVVAAMTLPMLAENYQRIVVQTRLKKFYTTFNQAILRAVDEHGPYEGWGYWNNEKYDQNGNLLSANEDNERSFSLYLRSYFSIVHTQKVVFTDNTESILYYLPDGLAFMFARHWNRDMSYFPQNPVRCLKLPAINRNGVCKFDFSFLPHNTHSLWRYHKDKGLEPTKFGWDGSIEHLYNDSVRGCNSTNAIYCAAVIQHNNWQFPSDYPRKIRY